MMDSEIMTDDPNKSEGEIINEPTERTPLLSSPNNTVGYSTPRELLESCSLSR